MASLFLPGTVKCTCGGYPRLHSYYTHVDRFPIIFYALICNRCGFSTDTFENLFNFDPLVLEWNRLNS